MTIKQKYHHFLKKHMQARYQNNGYFISSCLITICLCKQCPRELLFKPKRNEERLLRPNSSGKGWRRMGTKMVKGPHGVAIWRTHSEELINMGIFIRFKARNGTRIWFWKDICCDKVSLATKYNRLYEMAASKRAFMVETSTTQQEGTCWNLYSEMAFNDWEIEEVDNLVTTINSQKLEIDREDAIIWKRNSISHQNHNMRNSVEEGSRLFHSYGIGLYSSFFFFLVRHGGMQKRGVRLANRCYWCNAEEETVENLLIHYCKPKIIWYLMLNMFEIT